MPTFVHMVNGMGRATSNGNEAKSKMKQSSDVPTPRFEDGGSNLWSNTLRISQGENIIMLINRLEKLELKSLPYYSVAGITSTL